MDLTKLLNLAEKTRTIPDPVKKNFEPHILLTVPQIPYITPSSKGVEVDMTASKKVAIIANRLAGSVSGNSDLQFQTLAARSTLWGRDLEFHYPSSLSELEQLTSQIQPETHEALVVIGGDGTLNQVIRSFRNRPNPIPLLPFPGGTANDFAKELGLKPDWNQVQALLDRKQYEDIDLVEVNGVPFATVSGIGVGSILTSEFNERRKTSPLFKKLSRKLSFHVYTAMSAKTILTGRKYTYHLHFRAQGFDEKIKTPAVFLCNQAFLGGNLRVSPVIDNTDCRFNVLIVPSCSRLQLLKSMLKLKSGRLAHNYFVFSTDQMSISDLQGRKIRVFGDGEILTEDTTLEFKIRPRNLRAYRYRELAS